MPQRAGREAGGAIDSQSVKASAPGAQRGYDAGKKIVGRKRHIAVDTDGRLLMVNLTPADISDCAGAQAILDGIRKRWPRVTHLFADGLRSAQAHGKAAYLDFVIEIIRRSDVPCVPFLIPPSALGLCCVLQDAEDDELSGAHWRDADLAYEPTIEDVVGRHCRPVAGDEERLLFGPAEQRP